jgi:Tol biopolymer transport system component
MLDTADPVTWSPAADTLAGVTSSGGVVVGGPGQKTRYVLPARWGAEGTFAFDPAGRQLAVTRYPVNSCANGCPGDKGVWVVDLRTGQAREVYRVPSGHDVSPLVNGWSPDGKWVLFQPEPSDSVEFAADGLPLYAVPADGRPGLVRVMPNLLLEQRTLLTWCGEHLVVSAGINKNASFRGLHLVAAAPPAWRASPVSRDSSLGFAQPACDPAGTWVATVAGLSNDTEASTAPSALWVMRPDGSAAHEVAGTGGGRYQVNIVVDQLQWSADGRWILFTRERVTPRADAPVDLFLAEIDRATGRAVRIVGPVLGNTSTYAWYQP